MELTARRKRLALQEAPRTKEVTEYLWERRRQRTGCRYQLQRPEETSGGFKWALNQYDDLLVTVWGLTGGTWGRRT